MIDAHYDPEADALAINWGDAQIVDSDEIAPGVILDYDSSGNVVGVEVLNASKQIRQLEGKPLLITSTRDINDQLTARQNQPD